MAEELDLGNNVPAAYCGAGQRGSNADCCDCKIYMRTGDSDAFVLPENPSAKEMEENGINLSVMNMILLKKVEKLTG